MKCSFLTLLVLLTVNTFSYGIPRFDSAHSIALDAVLEQSELISDTDNELENRALIENQLFYFVGSLNGMGAVADLSRIQLTIEKAEKVENSKKQRVLYSAKFLVSWPREFKIPPTLTLPLPYQADENGMIDFFNRHSRFCSENDPNNSWDSYFYYLRPQEPRCRIYSSGKSQNTTFGVLKFVVSGQNTDGKTPEYGMVWADKALVSTIIVGTNEPGATGNTDIGISQFNLLYGQLWRSFGSPQKMNVALSSNALPGMKNPDIEMEWVLADGTFLNINLLLIDKMGLLVPSNAFKKRYEERTLISDFISYNGHSGLGANIRALSRLGKYRKDQYQLFFLNGCDTFAYIDATLPEIHHKLNPESGPYKYFDAITNAMPSPFSGFVQTNFSILRGLLNKKDTYRQILSRFNPFQKALVIGEEDN